MIAIEKIYCSFIVSKLLKEKGFNEYCLKNYWDSDEELHNWSYNGLEYHTNKEKNNNTKDCSAPTHEQAIIWLKENHNIWIYCYPSNWKEYGEWEGGACWIDENVSVIFNNSSHSLYANEPEEVIEMVLLYVLRNII